MQLMLIVIFILFFSATAKAQQVPNYFFLEVHDSNQIPVEGAKVESDFIFGSTDKNYVKQNLKTDEKGKAGFYLESNHYYVLYPSLFSVSKDGYFTFNDLGLINTYKTPAQVELLKIPQTDEEKRFLGDEQTKREFIWAAKTGDAKTVKNLLGKGISPDITISDLRGVPGAKAISAIELAVNSADAGTIKTLLEAGVTTSEKLKQNFLLDYLKADPFFWHKYQTENERKEILSRYENGAMILLKAGADVNAEDSNRLKPIAIAAQKGYTKVVEMLLGKGFSPNYADERGVTLLAYAAGDSYPPIERSKVETINLLLKAGADPNFSKDGCGSGLGGAAARGDVEAVQILLKHGAQINPNCGMARSPLIEAVDRNRVEAAKLLVEAGADKNARYYQGENALMLAAKKSEVEMVGMLLDKGFQVNDGSGSINNGWTPLFYALTSYGSPKPEIITMILKAGANPNIAVEDASGYCSTPLKLVAVPYKLDILKLLVENGADVNLACANGETVLSYAITRHDPSVVRMLIHFGANPNGNQIEKALNLIKTSFKEGDYERRDVDETIKIIEQARIAGKP